LLSPEEAVEELAGTDPTRRHFFHAPLLALFGSLQPEAFTTRNASAIAAAKTRAMYNLGRWGP
jgi:hypothetical protein